MQLNDQAENHLRLIRSMMEKAVVYRAMSAPTALAGGIFSILACAVLTFGGFKRPEEFLGAWIAVLGLTLLVNTLVVLREARERGGPLLSPSMRTALLAMLPALTTGAFFTAWLTFTVPIGRFMVVVWCIFYGLALLGGMSFAPRSMIWLGFAFLLFGLFWGCLVFSAQLMYFGYILKANDAMFVSFGLFHLVYAAAVWPRRSDSST